MATSQFGSASGGTSSTIGAAFPTTATAGGLKDQSGNMQPFLSDLNGYLEVNVKTGGSTPTPPSTAVETNIASSITNQTALASNANRLGATFFNDADTKCVLKYGATASASSSTAVVLPGATWRINVGDYSGQVDVIWISDTGAAAPTGSLRVTECTP